jgi:hypothetical protein
MKLIFNLIYWFKEDIKFLGKSILKLVLLK